MMNSYRKKIVLVCAIVALIAVAAFAFNQWLYLRKAHSSFDNYYAFRGCTQLLERTDTEGTCKTAAGDTVKIVEYQGKWYLDGDLPWACLGRLCLGI